jgi:predicted SnoaL-like aldol condensation-catalyzing enzyme
MSAREQNKDVVVDFYATSFAGNPELAVKKHSGQKYIQHNPGASDGPQAFIEFVHQLRSQYPNLELRIKRVIAEGDLVVTHSHLILAPSEAGQALADIFRLEEGKVVEHWDVTQQVPSTSANSNGMF